MPTKKTQRKTEGAKAAAKKVVSKKVTPKKVAPKKIASASDKKPLVYANNETSFWVANGQILNSLLALRDALAVMDKVSFDHHVSEGKNDFADWVETVLCDAECAQDLRVANTRTTAKTVVVRYLKRYAA